MLRACPVVVGERDEGAVLVPDAKYVPPGQGFAEWLVATNCMALVEEAIECAWSIRVRMNKYELTVLANDLEVLARNDPAIFDADVVAGISSNVHDFFRQ